jgi:hypothetical protein
MNYESFKRDSLVLNPLAQVRRSVMLVLIFCISAYVPAAQAKDRKANMPAAIKVVTSMSFENETATDMLIQQAGGKSYLYVQLADGEGVAVVDVTHPDQLKVVNSVSSFKGGQHLTINGNAATMTAENNASGAQSAHGELILWDVSNPSNPQVVQRFPGVLRVLQDDRHYTYILNQDRLWVVRDKQSAANDDSWDPSIYG